eukprot:330582_1
MNNEKLVEEKYGEYSMISNKCIVLDIDGTLIDSLTKQIYYENMNCLRKPDYIDNEDNCIWKRPGFDIFIKFCFDNFKHVSIWTAASKQWANIFINKIIKHEYKNKFDFIWCKDRLSKRFKINYYYSYRNAFITYKPLKKIWRSKIRNNNGWNKENTLIIEDTIRNCIDNYGNAIYVGTY